MKRRISGLVGIRQRPAHAVRGRMPCAAALRVRTVTTNGCCRRRVAWHWTEQAPKTAAALCRCFQLRRTSDPP